MTAERFTLDTRVVGSVRLIALSALLATFGTSCTLVLETVPHRDDVVVSVDGMTASDAMRADAPVDRGSDGTDALADTSADAGDVPAIDAVDDTLGHDAMDAIVTADSIDEPVTFDARRDVPDLVDTIDAPDIVISSDAGDARLDVVFDGGRVDGGFDVPFDRGFDTGFDVAGDRGFDVPTDRVFDSGFSDVAPDRIADIGAVVDGPVSDVRPTGDTGSTPCLNDGDCFAQYCGCTACTMDQVVCGTAATMASCTLACPSAPPCPYIDNVTCGCAAGTCVVVSRGGPGGAGTPCLSSTECMPGLLCCYPCGVAGCENICMDVGTTGACPMPL